MTAGVEGQAHAYPRISMPYASLLRKFDVTLTKDVTYHIKTTNLSDVNVDTWLHLQNSSGADLKANDDDPDDPTTKASHITHTATYTGTHTIFIHAGHQWSFGVADITINGSTFQSGVWVGGEVVDVPTGLNRFETAELLGSSAAEDVWLGAMRADGMFVGTDDNSGVGLMSRINNVSTADKVLVGGWVDAPTYAGWGFTKLYVNDHTGVDDAVGYPDVANDPDGDYLGSLLEAELGTCASNADPLCASIGVPAKDTDRDGLLDSAEVFGIESPTDPTHPQKLPKWGANPRHKDMFVEVDWNVGFAGGTPITATDLSTISIMYNAFGTGSVLKNPDGLDGIATHFDVGYAYGDPDVDTLGGDWGGANVTSEVEYGVAQTSQRRAVRYRVFRYALMQNRIGGGQAHGGESDYFEVGGLGPHHPIDFAHELAHTVNLEHNGHTNWGAANCKPNYLSVMNYSGPPEFSRGALTTTLDPSNFTEFGFLSPFDVMPLHFWPWFFVVDPSTSSADLNRDLTIHTTPMRGTVNDAAYQSCGTFKMGEQVHADGTADFAPNSTPRLVKSGVRLLHFWLGADGTVRYRHALQNGPKSAGSCPITGTLGAGACTTWSAPVATTLTGLKGFHVISHDAGGLLFASWATDNTVLVRRATTVDAAGVISGWQADVSVATSLVPPELARVAASGNKYGLFTTYLSGGVSTYRWHQSTTGASGTWTAPSNLPVTGAMTPSVTLVPPLGVTSGDAVRRPCGAFADNASPARVHLVCYESGTWQDLTNDAFKDSDACGGFGFTPSSIATPPGTGTCALGPQTQGPPSLVFHMARKPDGELHVDGPIILGTPLATWGQLHLTFQDWGDDGGPIPKVYRSGQLAADAASLTWVRFGPRSYFADVWAYSAPNTTVSYLEDISLGSLKAVRETRIGAEIVPSDRPIENRFYPFADGSIKATLLDGDDFKVMEFGVCKDLVGSLKCGASAWGLP